MSFTFEWDEEKAEQNIRKHQGVTVFDDPSIATLHDPDHSTDEDRYISLGYSSQGRLLIVSYSERGDNIRLISCRKATRQERKIYERGIKP